MSVKAIAGVMAIVLASGGAMAENPPWVFHDADPGKYMGMFSSIELDSSGRPHISYMGIEGNMKYVKYAHYDGGTWRQETIGLVGGNMTIGTSIAIDAQDKPHVTFAQEEPTWALKYAQRGSGGWSLESVEESYQVGHRSSLILAADSSPHVTYTTSRDNYSAYAYRDSAGWNVESAPGYGALAQGPDGVFHAMTWKHNWLYSSSYSGGAWSDPQSVVPGGFGVAMVIDAAGRTHVAHQELNADKLYYSLREGDSWTTEVVDGSGDVFTAAQVGLALDPQGRPMISYQVHIEGSGGRTYVQFAEWTGDEWSLERLAGERSAGSYGTSLAIDAVGRAYMTYYSTEDDQGLRVAVRVPEPATLSFLALGGLAVIRRRRRR